MQTFLPLTPGASSKRLCGLSIAANLVLFLTPFRYATSRTRAPLCDHSFSQLPCASACAHHGKSFSVRKETTTSIDRGNGSRCWVSAGLLFHLACALKISWSQSGTAFIPSWTVARACWTRSCLKVSHGGRCRRCLLRELDASIDRRPICLYKTS